MTEYLQDIKHKGKMESNCENKTECPQNRNADTVDQLTHPNGAQHMVGCVQYHYKEVCKSGRNKRLHSTDPQVEQHQDEDDIEKVNINSVYIDSIT